MRRLLVTIAMVGIAVLGGCGAPEGRAPNALKVTGTVIERLDGPPYTFLRIKTNAGERWAAVPIADVGRDSAVTIVNGVLLKDFETGVQGRRFDVVFGTLERRGRVLHQAKRIEGLPKIEQRANCTPATKELYAFAYRGESGAVHSSAVVLGSHAAGQAPFPATLMLGNVLVASMLVLAGVADLLDQPRFGEMAKRIRVEVRTKVPGT